MPKFKIGEIISHRAHGERAVIHKIGRGLVFPGHPFDSSEEDYYYLSSGNQKEWRLEQKIAEIAYELFPF
jgi:hypothetical protein